VRRILLLLLGLLVLPSVLAAGFGLWNPAAAWQEHLGLEVLLQLLLALEESQLHARLVGDGLIGGLEVGLLLGGVGLFLASCSLWEPRLPKPLARLVVLPESIPVLVGLVTAAAVVAVAAASARPLFWACALLGAVTCRSFADRPADSLREDSPNDDSRSDSWASPDHRLRRILTGLIATALGYYGVTSLWEGATYHNPVFEFREIWTGSLGANPLLAGGSWGLATAGIGATLLFWSHRERAATRDRIFGAGILAAVLLLGTALMLEPVSERRWSLLFAGPGLLVLAAGLGAASARWSPRLGQGWAVLDPRRAFASGLPILFGSGVLLLCSLSLNLWTPLGSSLPGVEKISDSDCVFSLGIDRQDRIFFTDRCAVAVGMIDSSGTRTWPLGPSGGEAVEELGGPDATGTFWAAIQAYALEAQLVLLAIEGPAGPRTVEPSVLGEGRARALGLIDEAGNRLVQTEADLAVARSSDQLPPSAQLPLPDCWLSSWIPVPGGGGREVLLGCENRTGGLIFDIQARSLVGSVDLSSRLESGTFSPEGDRLFGLTLWSDPYLHAFAWPGGSEIARRVIGPFNWDVLTVPGATDYQLWVPRFIEGVMLVLDPTSLETLARIPLSFGIRATHYEPLFGRVWAAASYSGELWSIETTPPYARSVFPLCGQTRDLVSDSRGGVIASTDCGIFRFDSATLFGEPPVKTSRPAGAAQ